VPGKTRNRAAFEPSIQGAALPTPLAPGVERGGIQADERLPRDARRRRHEWGELVVDAPTIAGRYSREQMPQREGVAIPRRREHGGEILRAAALEVEPRERGPERRRGVFEVRR